MENLVLLPTMAQKRRGNFGQFAEDATIISEETTRVKKVNHFIEANTMEIDLQHLQSDCIVHSTCKVTASYPFSVRTTN